MNEILCKQQRTHSQTSYATQRRSHTVKSSAHDAKAPGLKASGWAEPGAGCSDVGSHTVGAERSFWDPAKLGPETGNGESPFRSWNPNPNLTSFSPTYTGNPRQPNGWECPIWASSSPLPRAHRQAGTFKGQHKGSEASQTPCNFSIIPQRAGHRPYLPRLINGHRDQARRHSPSSQEISNTSIININPFAVNVIHEIEKKLSVQRRLPEAPKEGRFHERAWGLRDG